MADFQDIKDSSDILLSDNNFPLIRMSKHSTMFSLVFFPIYGFRFPIIRTYTYNFTNFVIFDYP